MFLITTRVNVKPESVDDCAQLFRDTNPDLVRGQEDWVGAQMVVDRENSEITVLASWRKIESYSALSNSNSFQSVMQKFSVYFTSPPSISVSEVLVSMTSDDLTHD